MTAREWKPGDVALLSSVNGEAAMGLAVGDGEVSGWRTEDGAFWGPKYTSLARPLVVIDPEDREAVERLAEALGWLNWYGTAGQLQAALREFANPTPPKPAEPTGLGAVVEDAEGHIFVRWARGAGCVWLTEGLSKAQFEDYAYIDAVRVLSEGVTA